MNSQYPSGDVCKFFQENGTCFRGELCKFRHDNPPSSAPSSQRSTSLKLSTMSTDAPAFVPASMSVSAPPFVPPVTPNPTPSSVNVNAAEFVPSSLSPTAVAFTAAEISGKPHTSIHAPEFVPAGAQQPMSSPFGMAFDMDAFTGMNVPLPTPKGNQRLQQIPNPLSTGGQLDPTSRPVRSYFMPEELRAQLIRENQISLSRLLPDDPQIHSLPLTLDKRRYHSLWPLPTDTMGGRAQIFKCTNSRDGHNYTIRRFSGNRMTRSEAKQILNPWAGLTQSTGADAHANIVAIRDVFSSQEFGDGGSLCVVYDFHPTAMTLKEKYFHSRNGVLVAESVLWSIACQLLSALSTIHASNMACGCVRLNYVLVSENARVRLNWCGVSQLLEPNPNASIEEQQKADLFRVGEMLLCLACQNINAGDDPRSSIEYLRSDRCGYSSEVVDMVMTLLDCRPDGFSNHTVFTICSMFSHRFVVELQSMSTQVDSLHDELSKEVCNGRLLRLLVKMCFISERAEHRGNPMWAETEDRYLIKLFRDFVFHTVKEDGNANVNFAHVFQHLNLLDVGSPEYTLLSGRKGDNVVLATYGELQRCIQEAFEELSSEK